MINELLKSSQTIIAALISGLIAITVAIIQNFAPLSKYRKDGKDKYKESINERLEKVYNPLIIYLSEMKDTNHSISNSIIEIFKQYGYLLTKDTFCDLYELIELQNSFDKSNGKVLTDLGKEYELLKNRLYNKVKSEFFKLQSIYYRDINEFTKKIETPWYMRLVKIIAWGCVWLTITFYIILIAQNLMLFVNANGPEVQVQSYTLKTVLRLYMYIIVLTTLIGGFLTIAFGIAKIITPIFRKFNRYMEYSDVIITGTYRCKVCGRKEKFIRFSQFPMCKHKTIF